MTSRERIQAALTHQEPDRTPVFEYVLLPPVAEQILGRPYCDYAGDPERRWLARARAQGWERALRQYVVDRLDLALTLGHDMLYVCPAPVLPSEPVVPVTEETTVDDPVVRVQRRIEQGMARPVVLNDDRFLVYRFLQEEMQRRGVDLPILAPGYAHGVWTNTDLMETMVLAPEVAHQHFELATRTGLALIEKYVELGIDQIGVGGDFAGQRPLISAAAYRDFIMPEVRRLSRRIHEAGRWAVNASDGNLWPVITDFLRGCEVDGYLEIDQRAGMELRPLKERFGDVITFYGNVDCGHTLTFGSPETIRQATIECLEAGHGQGGHIFCVSNAITASVPLANYLVMVNTYREAFGLAPVKLGEGA